MIELDFESDEKLKLLTEALRAGPGSPQWRDAVAQWRSNDGESEHQLLLRVREHLASGKSYREIRAGAGFTRRVMDEVDQEESRRNASATAPSAGWIAAIAGLVLIGVIAVVAFLVWPRPPADNVAAAAKLERTAFTKTSESATFDDSINPTWQTFGNLTLTADGGLRPAVTAATQNFKGGGVYWDTSLGSNQPFSVETSIDISKNLPKDVIVQLFVTDDRSFEGASATTAHELLWTLKEGEANVVLPDGHVAGNSARLNDGKQSLDVRIAIAGDQATVELNRRRMWTGAHQLDPGRTRTIGVRFLARGVDEPSQRVRVESIRIMQ